MIVFRYPELILAFGIPWLLIFFRFAQVQVRAVAWIDRRAAPRFRHRLTRYRGRGLRVHLAFLFLVGAALVIAAAGPTLPGEGEVRGATGGRVVLLLDSSASMGAEDSVVGVGEAAGAADRFTRARGIALELVSRLDGHRFALVGFSGLAAFQLPMTADRDLVLEAVASSELHTFYRSSGSNFAAALDAALHFAEADDPGLQVVVLSDGETSRYADAGYDAPLAALRESAVPIHAVAVGSAEGQGRVIYDMRDLVAEVEEPAALVEFYTRREVRHLRRMARRTGGLFQVDGPEAVNALVDEIRRHQVPVRVEDPRARRDVSHWLVGLFLVVFVADALLFDRRRPRGRSFDLDRLGPPPSGGAAGRALAPLLATVLLLPAAGCGDSALRRAHRENEQGIAYDTVRRHDAARPHYVRSIGYGEQSEVPTYNLGRSRTLAESWSEAHDLYQDALELDPDLEPALYNDGIALWRWGVAEYDPRGCQLERTRELWTAARGRFIVVRDRGGELAARADANERRVAEALAEVDALIADPPPECATPPPPPPPPDPFPEERQEGEQGGGTGGGGGGAGSPPPLTEEEEETIRQAQQRIEEQRGEEGKFFRRSPTEQFPGEAWQNPDDEIWW